MSPSDMSRTGRNLFWARRGVEECGGGFLGLFLSILIGRSEKKSAERRDQAKKHKPDIFDRILQIYD